MEDEHKANYADDFPSSANEPVFEALPDYRLTTDEMPLFETGENKLSTAQPDERLFDETTLDEKTLNELEAFIARARAKKGRTAPADGFSPVSPKPKSPQNASTRPLQTTGPDAVVRTTSGKPAGASFSPKDIPFEVDFGDGRVEEARLTREERTEVSPSVVEASVNKRPEKPSFEFAFTVQESADSTAQPTQPINEVKEQIVTQAEVLPSTDKTSVKPGKRRKTKDCPDCHTELPEAARFCFSCGYPQLEEDDSPSAGAKAPGENFLVLEELPDPRTGNDESVLSAADSFIAKPDLTVKRSASEPATAIGNNDSPTPSGAISTKKYTMAELKQAFREYFQERIIAYFGSGQLKKYYAALEKSNSFQQLRDGSLTNLVNWINGGERTYASVTRRINDTLADLTEYFIVEIAGDLHGQVLPQRLLRHQSVDWNTVDLFKLVMDFLDFEAETERVYTDFVSMPARALRNATNAFLRAGKDERIFFICDQSLISQAKNGFSVTDAGIYWKNVLQPAGSALFTTIEKVSINQGHLEVDGQFFNAGAGLNLKMAVLLDKLRRMR